MSACLPVKGQSCKLGDCFVSSFGPSSLFVHVVLFCSSAQGDKQAAVPPPTSISDGGEKQNVAAQLNSTQKGEFRCHHPCVRCTLSPQPVSAQAERLCRRPPMSIYLSATAEWSRGGGEETRAALNHRFNGGQRCMRAFDMSRPV